MKSTTKERLDLCRLVTSRWSKRELLRVSLGEVSDLQRAWRKLDRETRVAAKVSGVRNRLAAKLHRRYRWHRADAEKFAWANGDVLR